MMRCPAWRKSRAKLFEKVNCLIDVPDHTSEEVAIADFIMDRACTDCQLMKIIEVNQMLIGSLSSDFPKLLCLTLIDCMYM